MRHPFLLQRSRGICWVSRRAFSGTTRAQACRKEKSQDTKSIGRENQLSQTPRCTKKPPTQPLPTLSLPFWTCRSTWKRAGINTLRCLVGCTAGDFSALWILQTYYPEMGMSSIMALSMASGITTSVILETILLRRGADQLSWPMAARTAMGMSMVSICFWRSKVLDGSSVIDGCWISGAVAVQLSTSSKIWEIVSLIFNVPSLMQIIGKESGLSTVPLWGASRGKHD
ncbi:hypothetical protein ACN42_g1490 [Penicillium freii]|uniref:DUF4396 domain-containing protein n=1 Tax=Penicillium freii TaxID=48697 RepID=A0A101MS20_PENFR|nr:hypothetical protein ACN42_g1490 [Penicillium freii]